MMPSQAGQQLFTAVTQNVGKVVLRCDTNFPDTEVHGNLASAITLAAIDSFCTSLEQTLQEPLDFKSTRLDDLPGPHEEDSALYCDLALPASTRFKTGEIRVRVEFEDLAWDWLVSGGHFFSQFDAQWSTVASRLCLQELAVSVVEMNKIAPGALVILPNSLQSRWSVVLEERKRMTRVRATLDSVSDKILRQASDGEPVTGQADAGAESTLSVWWTQSVAVPVDYFFQSDKAQPPAISIGDSVVDAVLQVAGDARHSGQLITIGSGKAVSVQCPEESVEECGISGTGELSALEAV